MSEPQQEGPASSSPGDAPSRAGTGVADALTSASHHDGDEDPLVAAPPGYVPV